MKEIIEELDFVKIKKFCSVKDNVKRIKQTTDLEKMFAKGIFDKGLLSEIHEELLFFIRLSMP